MVYSENLEGNPDVNPGEGETARETARFFCGWLREALKLSGLLGTH